MQLDPCLCEFALCFVLNGLTTLWLTPSHLVSLTCFCPLLPLFYLLALIASDGCNERD